MGETNLITLALSKGRIFEETLPLLKAAGIEVLEDPEKSRKLILPTNQADVRILLVRASDVPTYVQYAGADLGVVGKDTLLETGHQGLYVPLDLGGGGSRVPYKRELFLRGNSEVLLCLETFWRNGRWHELFPHSKPPTLANN